MWGETKRKGGMEKFERESLYMLLCFALLWFYMNMDLDMVMVLKGE